MNDVRLSGNPRRRQGGIGLIGAIAVLVIMAGIGAAFVTLNTNQQTISALDVTQSRALLAARSGLEWGLFNWQATNGGCATPQVTFALPPNTTISKFRVTVNCALVAAGDTQIVRITANACNAAAGNCPVLGNALNPDYVERELYADVPFAPTPAP